MVVVFTSVEERLVFGNCSCIGNCGCGCIDLSTNYGNRPLFNTKIYKPDWDCYFRYDRRIDGFGGTEGAAWMWEGIEFPKP
jgi:hypothetical protein